MIIVIISDLLTFFFHRIWCAHFSSRTAGRLFNSLFLTCFYFVSLRCTFRSLNYVRFVTPPQLLELLKAVSLNWEDFALHKFNRVCDCLPPFHFPSSYLFILSIWMWFANIFAQLNIFLTLWMSDEFSSHFDAKVQSAFQQFHSTVCMTFLRRFFFQKIHLLP